MSGVSRTGRTGNVLMRNLLAGLLAAAGLALILGDAHVFGIAFWKIALAGLGLALFVRGGRR